MEALLVRRFAREFGARGTGALVRRAVPVAEGLLIALQIRSAETELGFSLAPGAGGCWLLDPGARAALHGEIAALAPGLVAPLPELQWRERDATALDALRAWIVRPGTVHPGWARLETARVTGVRARGADRVLEIDFETRDALGAPSRLQLTCELFDRNANLRLVDVAGGREIANWSGRPAAPERDGAGVAASDLSEQAVLRWTSERGVWLDADSAAPGTLSLAAAMYLRVATAAARELVSKRTRALRREVSKLERLCSGLDGDARNAAEADDWRAQGELLAANQHRVKRGQKQVTVEDWAAGGAPRDIELDPDLSPQENVALYFKRARRGARGRDTIEARRESTRAALEVARDALAALPVPAAASAASRAPAAPASPSASPAPEWDAAARAGREALRLAFPQATATTLTALWSAGGPGWRASGARTTSDAAPAAPSGPGRRFLIEGEWEVRVGRSNAENDVLTHRFAHPEDVWLHASGVPGSHVVLRMRGRTDNPPRGVLEAAAAIAARFSKAKHAGTVPVIWTRKRHVRKPRGSKPGLATCTHEKTIFVRPGLPDGAESE